MQIEPGARLGPYEIVGLLGAGGMGEVHRAKDTRLGREVAIKDLPSHLSDNPELKARFEREAKAISQLTHPHICTLYEGVGETFDQMSSDLGFIVEFDARATAGYVDAHGVIRR